MCIVKSQLDHIRKDIKHVRVEEKTHGKSPERVFYTTFVCAYLAGCVDCLNLVIEESSVDDASYEKGETSLVLGDQMVCVGRLEWITYENGQW